MPTPPEATRHNNLTKLLVLLPLRANSKRTFQCETPCRTLKNVENFQKTDSVKVGQKSSSKTKTGFT